MEFYDIDPKELDLQPLGIFATDGALLTPGTSESWNTMTIGWGSLGTLWRHPMATVYVRADRHTHAYMESSDRFTIAFLNERDAKKLEFCGTHSGRDTDKTTCGLTPMEVDDGAIAFEEAELIIACRKVYAHPLEPHHFTDTDLYEEIYGGGVSLHTVYRGIVEHVYVAASVLEEHEGECDDPDCADHAHHRDPDEAKEF